MVSSTKPPDDCDGADNSAVEDISLGDTVLSFQNRLQRKLKAQEKAQDVSDRKRDERHKLMLKAMTTIRRAMQDTCKIRLGERFSFELEVSDWQGWPQVELTLIDSVAPTRKDYGLIVSANDRNDLGTIVMTMRPNEVVGKVHLCDAEEFNKLPLLLKRTVRGFLDLIGEYVLNPKKPEELLEVQTQKIEDEQLDEINAALTGVDVFSEDHGPVDDNIVPSEDNEPTPKKAAKKLDDIDLFEPESDADW